MEDRDRSQLAELRARTEELAEQALTLARAVARICEREGVEGAAEAENESGKRRRRRHLRVVEGLLAGFGAVGIWRRLATASAGAAALAAAVAAISVPLITQAPGPGIPGRHHGVLPASTAPHRQQRRHQTSRAPGRRSSGAPVQSPSPGPGPVHSPSPAPTGTKPAPVVSASASTSLPPVLPSPSPSCTINLLGICVKL